MQCKDIPDERVVELARRWWDFARTATPAERRAAPGVVEALMIEFGIPYKLALVKVERLCRPKGGKGALLDYGTSPNYAWPVSS